MAIPTPHIGCSEQGVIAETVLLPGDPLRAKFIADTFLEHIKGKKSLLWVQEWGFPQSEFILMN